MEDRVEVIVPITETDIEQFLKPLVYNNGKSFEWTLATNTGEDITLIFVNDN